MLKNFNDKLIETIKRRIVKKTSVAEALMEILPMRKEAIYRRLRGEVQFSFEEASIISQKMNFSLDEITVSDKDNYTVFNINLYHNLPPLDAYLKSSISTLDDMLKLEGNSGVFLNLATNSIPQGLLAKYEHLSKIQYYKWLHDSGRIQDDTYKKYSEISFPKGLMDLQDKFLSISDRLTTTYILTDCIFDSFIRNIVFFKDLGLIDIEEVTIIKEELHKLIDELGTIMANGTYLNDAKISIYLANVHFESSYAFMKSKNQTYTYSLIYLVNYAKSKNYAKYEAYKDAFEVLKSYSTLVSKSGLVKRMEFLQTQHELVDSML